MSKILCDVIYFKVTNVIPNQTICVPGVRAGGTEKGPAKQPVATLPANQANGTDSRFMTPVQDLWFIFQKRHNATENGKCTTELYTHTHTGVGKINKQVFFRCGFVHPLVPT